LGLTGALSSSIRPVRSVFDRLSLFMLAMGFAQVVGGLTAQRCAVG
jgi:hypothetical protein